MPGYMIVYSTVSDPARFAEYVRAVGPLIASHGGRMLGRSVPPVVLEGVRVRLGGGGAGVLGLARLCRGAQVARAGRGVPGHRRGRAGLSPTSSTACRR